MKTSFEKYIPFSPVQLEDRQWPNRVIKRAPIWCSVDLRDGNQALVEPMNLEEKITFFNLLVSMGFKEIEVGFPSASETEYEIVRALIEMNLIPDDVTIQVLVQSREHLIEKTFEAVTGAKNVIVHFYNSTSTLQRKVVFKKDMEGIIEIAVNGARLIKELMKKAGKNSNIRIEYSPESFSGTEIDNSVRICTRVMEEIGATPDNKIILNLPSTVQLSTPNHFADQVEYFCRNLPNRDAAIISVHPHNDRGTGVADAELAMMAGAERVEGTIFGNGERTGNVDIVTLALNLFSQGINPMLDFSDINHVKEVYEATTKMYVHERHPYGGKLVFTAFSGSHQDAINKGFEYMKKSKTEYWEVPYLPIDPADIGRKYEPVIRINSQSGKGGAAFIMQQNFGYHLPKSMHPEFGAIVKAEADRTGKELTAHDIMELFRNEYLVANKPYSLKRHKIVEGGHNGESLAHFEGSISTNGVEINISGEGNGPIDAFFNALNQQGIRGYEFISYHEHAISSGSDAKAVAYIELKKPDGNHVFGVGIENNINIASIKGVLCAINRALKSN
ncbi:MAG: 2-isopropylmalate synthase [Bacillota bacterium]|jgi:2-isopropylmalate synthase